MEQRSLGLRYSNNRCLQLILQPIVEIHTSICTKLAVLVGGCFAFLAVLLSIFLEFQHLTSYTNTSEQNWMVAVIFMVHVYASESIISLSNPKTSLACDILRTCYEAFALYAFGSYLVACLVHVGCVAKINPEAPLDKVCVLS